MFYVQPICLRTAIWFILAFLSQGLPFFGEDRLPTLVTRRRLITTAESC